MRIRCTKVDIVDVGNMFSFVDLSRLCFDDMCELVYKVVSIDLMQDSIRCKYNLCFYDNKEMRISELFNNLPTGNITLSVKETFSGRPIYKITLHED